VSSIDMSMIDEDKDTTTPPSILSELRALTTLGIAA